jgi:hypothetical protein
MRPGEDSRTYLVHAHTTLSDEYLLFCFIYVFFYSPKSNPFLELGYDLINLVINFVFKNTIPCGIDLALAIH